jgi:flagellar biosynthesis anti-sigma factor FlgM
MSLRIPNQAQAIDPSADLKSTSTQQAAATASAKTSPTSLGAVGSSPDTTSISAATSQLSGDVAIRQDRVDALRTQMDNGTYTVNSRAVATAMFQNLFRS